MKLVQNPKLILTLALWLSLGLAFGSCRAEASKSGEKTEQSDKGKKASLIKQVNAEYMREHIYDYTANPGEWKYKGDKPAIIDFYADWCGPCRALSPKLEEAARKYEGKIQIYKVNVDKEVELAQIFGVQSLPTVLFVPVEGIPTMSMGNMPKEQIEKGIQEILTTKTTEL